MLTLLELRQKRAKLVRDMAAYNTEHSEHWSADNDARFTDLEAELTSLDGEIRRRELLDARQAELDQREGRDGAPNPGAANPNPARTDPTAPGQEQRDCPWATFGAFLHDVRFNPQRLEVREMNMTIGEHGGILVPPQFATELLRSTPQEAIVRPRARVIPPGETPEAEMSFPALTQGADGVYGGVTVTWVEEGAAPGETSGRLEEVSLRAKEVAADVVVSNRLLRNSSAAGAIISVMLRDAIIGSEDYTCLRGNGIGKPLGILNLPGRLTVARGTANTIKTLDTLAMLQRLPPESAGSAVWIVNQSALTQIATLADANDNAIFHMGDATKGLLSTLWGIPVIFTGRTPVLGATGDLLLVDFRYYMVRDGVGPIIATSEHVKFRENKTVIKIVRSVDGQGWVRSPLTLEDGATQVSPYVVLS